MVCFAFFVCKRVPHFRINIYFVDFFAFVERLMETLGHFGCNGFILAAKNADDRASDFINEFRVVGNRTVVDDRPAGFNWVDSRLKRDAAAEAKPPEYNFFGRYAPLSLKIRACGLKVLYGMRFRDAFFKLMRPFARLCDLPFIEVNGKDGETFS